MIVCVFRVVACAFVEFVVLDRQQFRRISSRQSMGADDRSNGEGWQTQRRRGSLSGQLRADKILAEAITIDGRKNGIVAFACGRDGRAGGAPQTFPARLQVKKRQLVSARNGGCSSGSSSSGGKNKKHQDPEAEVRELREELKRFKNAEKKQGVQCELAGEEGRFEEEGRMEVDEEAESKKKLD